MLSTCQDNYSNDTLWFKKDVCGCFTECQFNFISELSDNNWEKLIDQIV